MLASIRSCFSFTNSTTRLEAATTAILVFTVAAHLFLFALGVLAVQEMEAERNRLYQGDPMLVDDPEEGLPFPHIIGDDGQHTVQHIDM